jgi:hypothetical protein
MLTHQWIPMIRSIAKNDPERFVEFASNPEFDWEGCFRCCYLHGLVYQLHLICKEIAPMKIPGHVASKFHTAMHSQLVSSVRFMKRTEWLAELFEEHGKEVIFLKGPLFAERYHGGVQHRPIGDIDLLIPDWSESLAYEQILLEAGFKRKSLLSPSNRIQFWCVHNTEYVRSNVPVELHWTFRQHFSYSIQTQRIWQDKQEIEFQNRHFNIASDLHTLLLLTLSVFHDTERGNVCFRSWYDIYKLLQYIDDECDWTAFSHELEEIGAQKIVLNVLNITLLLMDSIDEFPQLCRVISRYEDLLSAEGETFAMCALGKRRALIGTKRLAFTFYRSPQWVSILWWGLTLPVRLLQHPAGLRDFRAR